MSGLRILVVGSFIVGSIVAFGTARAETASLAPVRDNTLFQSATGALSNGAGDALYVGMNSGSNVRRALLRFDVSGALPPGAVIESADLHLTVSNVPNGNPTVIEIRRVLADWGEGASVAGGGSGAPADTLDATWLHAFHPDSFWTSAGGDFDPAVRASATIAGTGAFVWSDSSLAEDVQAWLDDPAGNFGWILTGDESTPASARRIDSREAVDPATRPTLVLQYRPGPTALEGSSWGATKVRYGGGLEGSPGGS